MHWFISAEQKSAMVGHGFGWEILDFPLELRDKEVSRNTDAKTVSKGIFHIGHPGKGRLVHYHFQHLITSKMWLLWV